MHKPVAVKGHRQGCCARIVVELIFAQNRIRARKTDIQIDVSLGYVGVGHFLRASLVEVVPVGQVAVACKNGAFKTFR